MADRCELAAEFIWNVKAIGLSLGGLLVFFMWAAFSAEAKLKRAGRELQRCYGELERRGTIVDEVVRRGKGMVDAIYDYQPPAVTDPHGEWRPWQGLESHQAFCSDPGACILCRDLRS